MIVIVIVGILSAVALPNFLNQTKKAKATECITQFGALLTEVATEALGTDLATGVATVSAGSLATANSNSDLCTYALATPSAGDTTATGTINGKANTDLAGEEWNGCVNTANGKKDIRKGAGGTASGANPADCA